MGAIFRRDSPDSAQSSPSGLAVLCQDLVRGRGESLGSEFYWLGDLH